MGSGKFRRVFTFFMNIALKYLFILVLIVVFAHTLYYLIIDSTYVSFELIGILMLFIFGFYYAIKKGVGHKKILVILVVMGFIVRVAWVLSVNSIPRSDFSLIYRNGTKFLEGDYSIFKGTSYFARFPHITILCFYFAYIQKFFGQNALIVIKLINCICSTVNIMFIYLICKEVFDGTRRALCGAFIAAFYPPIILYCAVYCSENMAIPFFLASVYAFILVVKNKKSDKWIILSGILLTIGNLFRMVAPVMVIAYLVYIFIYEEKKLSHKFKSSALLVIAFVVPLVIVSNGLKFAGITEFQLWRGIEPSTTSIMKGSNLNSGGRWNSEDAQFVDKYLGDYDKLKEESMKVIEKRYSEATPLELFFHFIRKYSLQWREGDFSGSYWAQLDLKDKDISLDMEHGGSFFSQLVFLILVVLTYIGLYNDEQYNENKLINLFYIIYCGYGLLFLISESQDRYSFIVSWLFIILPLTVTEGTELWKE